MTSRDTAVSPPCPAAGSTARVPRPVRVARGLLGAVALSHVVVPVAVALDDRGGHAVRGALEVHGPLLVLTLLLVWTLPSGRSWTRRMSTVSQLLSLGFGVVLWSSPPTYAPLVPVVGSVQVVVVVLLWCPAVARRFFAGPGVSGVTIA